MKIRHKKLKEWIDAGLITVPQGDAIHAYEEEKRGGRFGRGLVGLSIFAILVGVLSIIAANWHEIPGTVKILAHIVLNAAIGGFAVWADKQGKDLWREGAALAFLGLTFTLIILIGQVFQMTGTAADATLFWLIITLPFFLLMGRGYMTATPWMIAFLSTVVLVMVERLEPLPREYKYLFSVGVSALLPLALMADGSIAAFRRLRPALADVMVKAGAMMAALTASLSIIFWPVRYNPFYKDHLISEFNAMIILGVGAIWIAAHAAYYRFYRDNPAMKVGAVFAAVSLFVFIMPFLLKGSGLSLVAALVLIAYWVFIGWSGQMLHKSRIVSLAITIIAIRIFVIYLELFGSLMNTGLGLISGGVVMLVLIYIARRLNNRMVGKAVR